MRPRTYNQIEVTLLSTLVYAGFRMIAWILWTSKGRIYIYIYIYIDALHLNCGICANMLGISEVQVVIPVLLQVPEPLLPRGFSYIASMQITAGKHRLCHGDLLGGPGYRLFYLVGVLLNFNRTVLIKELVFGI